MDGLRPDVLIGIEAPNIDALERRGARTWQAQTVFPSNTLPAHASMLSGYEPAAHGITWDDYYPQRGPIRVPTVFSIARAAGLRTVMVVGKDKFAQLNAPGTVDAYVLATRGDEDVANQAVVQIQAGFDLMFVHLPNTDLMGHSKGWMSSSFLDQVSRTDQALGRIVAALPQNTTLILSSDHGGQGRGHGTKAPADMTIPWLIAGPNVAERLVLTSRVRTVDTAATAAYVLGLPTPQDITGRPVLEAFLPSQAARSGAGSPILLPTPW